MDYLGDRDRREEQLVGKRDDDDAEPSTSSRRSSPPGADGPHPDRMTAGSLSLGKIITIAMASYYMHRRILGAATEPGAHAA
jgi:hypothetical protein